MPGPPPPPPPGAPPPPSFPAPPSKLGGGADDRGALLNSIRAGAKLKKTVTNDKSAPVIGKVSNVNNNGSTGGGGNGVPAPHSTTNGLPLAGLFAGGMPKLKATGRPGASTLNNNNNNNDTGKKFNSIQDQLKKQLHSPSDTRTRGPPPPAPVRNVEANGALHANVSTLHRKSKSNANLSSLDSTDDVKPVINYGKPNLAPKPPTLNGKPTPLKLSLPPGKISRAQSMRTPRSPSPQNTQVDGPKFGTVRNMSSLIGQSLTSLNSSPRTRAPLPGRPSVPPPSVPSGKQMRPPNHAPPPPPSHAPPPPPHKTASRAPPAVPQNSNPPPPPPRNSSMRDQPPSRRNGVDLEERYGAKFRTIDQFPTPPPYRHVLKVYSTRQVSSKHKAPPPPLQPPNKMWNPASTC